jgi:hypothetical protein
VQLVSETRPRPPDLGKDLDQRVVTSSACGDGVWRDFVERDLR